MEKREVEKSEEVGTVQRYVHLLHNLKQQFTLFGTLKERNDLPFKIKETFPLSKIIIEGVCVYC